MFGRTQHSRIDSRPDLFERLLSLGGTVRDQNHVDFTLGHDLFSLSSLLVRRLGLSFGNVLFPLVLGGILFDRLEQDQDVGNFVFTFR